MTDDNDDESNTSNNNSRKIPSHAASEVRRELSRQTVNKLESMVFQHKHMVMFWSYWSV